MKFLEGLEIKEKRVYKFSLTENEKNSGLQVSVYYDRGGYNYCKNKNDPRGYWLSLQPYNDDGIFTIIVPSDGVKYFLKEVKRQSKKAFNEAVQKISEDILSNMQEKINCNLTNEDIHLIINTLKEN